jgi:hypothetical protein
MQLAIEMAYARMARTSTPLRNSTPMEVQAILDEQNQRDEPKVARKFRVAYVATVTLHDGEGESLTDGASELYPPVARTLPENRRAASSPFGSRIRHRP